MAAAFGALRDDDVGAGLQRESAGTYEPGN
jgi:hypothetical protein